MPTITYYCLNVITDFSKGADAINDVQIVGCDANGNIIVTINNHDKESLQVTYEMPFYLLWRDKDGASLNRARLSFSDLDFNADPMPILPLDMNGQATNSVDLSLASPLRSGNGFSQVGAFKFGGAKGTWDWSLVLSLTLNNTTITCAFDPEMDVSVRDS